MKKITFLLTTAFLAVCYSQTSKADSYNYTPYIGVDYTYEKMKSPTIEPYHNAIGLHIGSDYSRYFGTEIFFNQSEGDKRHKNGTGIKTSYRSYGLDLMAYLPLGCYKRFSLLGTVGVGEYVFKITRVPQKHNDEHERGYRFGGGFKYAVSKNIGFRMIARRVNFDKSSNYKHSMEYSTGIEYHF